MLNRIFTVGAVMVLFSVKSSFAQADRSNETSEISTSEIIDFTKTINPRPDLVGQENNEKREKQLISFDTAIPNSTKEDGEGDGEEMLEKKRESFDQVVNPKPETEDKD